MKRDNDLVRALLLEAEQKSSQYLLVPETFSMSDHDEKKSYHAKLLCDAGYFEAYSLGSYRLTNAGHDFLDAIKDEGLWQKTKKTVQETGGNVTLEFLKTIAFALLKKQIEEKTGLEL